MKTTLGNIMGGIIGLVAFPYLTRGDHDVVTGVIVVLAVLLLGAVGLHGIHLANLQKREWLRRADRTEPSPVADTDLRTSLVEADRDEHITRLDPEDDEAIRRA